MIPRKAEADINGEQILLNVTKVTSVATGERDEASAEVTNAVRYLLDRYQLTHSRPIPQTIAVVSPVGGEGVTTVSRALAELLSSRNDTDACWIDMAGTQRSSSSKRHELTDATAADSGSSPNTLAPPPVIVIPTNRTATEHHIAAVGDPRVDDLLERLGTEYEFLVFDTPPVLSDSSSLGLLRHADAYLLVARYGSTTIKQIQTLTEELRVIPSIGTVLNMYRTRTPRSIRRRFSE